MNPVKERPILFSGEMVRAILTGQKTQTRRIAKPVKHPDLGNLYDPGALVLEREPQHVIDRACPYGQPGDLLWVRETWGVISHSWNEYGEITDWVPDRPAKTIRELPFGKCYYTGHVIYAADGSNQWAGDDAAGGEPRSAWHPSIHMPRAASRILLEVVSVRVERLQDISEADALAEGVKHCEAELDTGGYWYAPEELYSMLWTKINGWGDSGWNANPWVWVVEFRRVEE